MDTHETTSALLVIDVQREALKDCPDGDGVVARINDLSRAASSAGTPVVFIQHEDDDLLVKGSPTWELAEALERPDGSQLVPKTFRDAFEQTQLERLLESLGVRHLVVTGVHSDFCVQTSALSALIRGFDITLVSDGHAAQSSGGELSPQAVQDFINSRFATLRYPGRSVEVRPSAEISFEPPRSGAADQPASAPREPRQ